MTIQGIELLQVKCDGAFPLTCWVNFTDIDEASPAFGASFCVAGEVEMSNPPITVSLAQIQEARDRKRAEFASAETGSERKETV